MAAGLAKPDVEGALWKDALRGMIQAFCCFRSPVITYGSAEFAVELCWRYPAFTALAQSRSLMRKIAGPLAARWPATRILTVWSPATVSAS